MGWSRAGRGGAERRASIPASGPGRTPRGSMFAASGRGPAGRGFLPFLLRLPRLRDHMPRHLSRFTFVVACLVPILAVPGASLAGPLQVVASDANGVTLQLAVGAWTLSAPDADGRVTIPALPESHSMSFPGRPLLPAYSAVLPLPPDA